MLDSGAKIEALDNNGQTVLCYATETGHANVMELLIQKNANIKAEDDWVRLHFLILPRKGI